MLVKYSPGDTAYIIESGLFVRKVEIVKAAGGFATLRFLDGKGGIRLRENRLYPTREDAEAHISQKTHTRPE